MKKAPSPRRSRAPVKRPRREFSIDALAREAGITVRNVRAYRERGLLPAPELRGRVGYYTEAHLARLRVIGRMLERGYSLGNVSELLDAWASGEDIGKLLGLEAAVTAPWSEEEPSTVALSALLEQFGGSIAPAAVAKATRLGVLDIQGSSARIRSAKLLQLGAILVKEGVPLEDLLDIVERIRTDLEREASALLQLMVTHVFDRYGKDALPPREEAPRLAALVWELRSLATQSLEAEIARAMEKAMNRALGDRLSHVIEELKGMTYG